MRKIITITHEFASGGREIARKTADKLGIACYADEIADKTAAASGFSADYIRQNAEKKTESFLYNLYMNSLPVSDKIFLIQSEVIKELSKEPCIIVGSCADYVLRDEPNLIRVFIHAPFEERIKRAEASAEYCAQKYGKEHNKDHKHPHGNTTDFVRKTDKRRIGYYNYFTSLRWGDASDYDIALNSAMFGFDRSADIIAEAYRV
jgi:cytidylate kinase